MLRGLLDRIQRQRADLVAERDEQLLGRRDLAQQLELVLTEHREEIEQLVRQSRAQQERQ